MDIATAAVAAVLSRQAMDRHVRSALPDAPVVLVSPRRTGTVHRARARTASLLARAAEAVAPKGAGVRPAVSPECAAM